MKIKSHQASGIPDWEQVAPEDRTVVQKIAAASRGIVTPGNAVTAASAWFSVAGIKDIRNGKKGRGIVKLAIGGVGDRVDGTVADVTRTKSPVGEAADAVTDKLVIGYGTYALAMSDVLPPTTTAEIIVPSAINTALTFEARRRGRTIHPGWPNKYMAGLQRSATGLHALESLAVQHDRTELAGWLGRAARITAHASVVSAVIGTAGYIRDIYGPPVPHPE